MDDDDQEQEPRSYKKTAAAITKIKIRDKIEDNGNVAYCAKNKTNLLFYAMPDQTELIFYDLLSYYLTFYASIISSTF